MDGEIVGLLKGGNGRSCTCHDVCGKYLASGDLIVFKATLTDEGEQAIKAVVVKDGTELCTVAFLPRNVVVLQAEEFQGKFAQVLDLYEESSNRHKRRKSKDNYGMASFILLDNIVSQE